MSEKKRRILHIGLAVAVLVAGVALFKVMSAQRPEIEKKKPKVPTPLVRTTTVNIREMAVHVGGEGTVTALKEIELVPQVAGKVVFVSPSLVNGGSFVKDQELLRIDPSDYEVAVTLARARVKDSESKLRIAQEEAAAAREEWRLLHEDDPGRADEPPPLVAKEPQLEAAKAQLAADRADLMRAELDLKRTKITSPFTGRVANESVDIGQYVVKGQALATLYSTDAVEIVVPLDTESLGWIHVPGFTRGSGPGSRALVEANLSRREETWRGSVVRSQGKLDERTRMVNVVIRVDNPYARRPPLAPGLFVSVDIEGRKVEGAAVIPRAALRESGVVWVVGPDSRLRFREVEVARVEGNDAIITSGLSDRELVVVSHLKAVSDGMKVRVNNVKEGGL